MPSQVHLFSAGDIALEAHSTAMWIDNSTGDKTGKWLAGALLKLPPDDEPENDMQITTFDKTPMRAAERWVDVEVDDRGVASLSGRLGRSNCMSTSKVGDGGLSSIYFTYGDVPLVSDSLSRLFTQGTAARTARETPSESHFIDCSIATFFPDGNVGPRGTP